MSGWQRPRIRHHRADLRVCRQRADPIDTTTSLSVGVEQRNVDSVFRVVSNVELDNKRAGRGTDRASRRPARTMTSKSFTTATRSA